MFVLTIFSLKGILNGSIYLLLFDIIITYSGLDGVLRQHLKKKGIKYL